MKVMFQTIMRVLFFWMTFLLAGYKVSIAQDPEFTQFYANPVYLNPAFAGSGEAGRLGINYRSQWSGIEHPFTTFSASYDEYIKKLSGGLGIQVVHHGAGSGTYQSNSATGVYSYHSELSRKISLNAGANAGYTERSIKWDEMTFGDMIDPDLGFIYDSREIQHFGSRGYLDLSAGVLLYSEALFGGVAVSHLHEPVTGLSGDSRLPRRYTAHAGSRLNLGNSITGRYTVSPNFLYTKQGEFEQMNLGMYVKSGVITAGFWYRSKDAIILLFGVQTDRYNFGYSYDMTISRLTAASGGSHELSLLVNIPKRIPKKKYKQLPCAVF